MKNWIVVMALLMAPAVLVAQKVTADSDPAGRFGSYHTYAWTTGTPASNPLAEARIHNSVEQQLAAKGFSKSNTPDVFVATLVATNERQELIANGFYGGFLYGGLDTATVQTYVVGTLIVDIYDAQTKKLVWRGTGTDTMSSKPEKNTRKVEEALEKIFARYPGGQS